MTAAPRDDRRHLRPRAETGDDLGLVLDALRRPVAAPDQTPQIMRRLGFRWMQGRARRRRRLRRVASRAGLVLGCILTVGISLHVYSNSSRARGPVDTTIPNAVEQEFRRIDGAIRRIRSFTPPRPPAPRAVPGPRPPVQRGIEGQIDRSAVGPVRWI